MQQSCTYNIDNTKDNTKEKESISKDIDSTKNFQLGTKKPKKENLYTKCIGMIDDFTHADNLRKLLIQYLNFRLEIKNKPLYANQWKGMLNKLNKLKDIDDISDIIQQSIDKGYLSFYPVKKQCNYNPDDKKSLARKFCQPENGGSIVYTDEEREYQEKWREEMRKQGKRVDF